MMKRKSLYELAKKVLTSDSFKNAKEKAESNFSDDDKMTELLRKSERKSGDLDKEKISFIQKIKIMIRMVKAYRSGEYTVMPWLSIIFITAGLIYFISPIDLIPDFLPVLGLTDDLSVILFIFSRLNTDFEKFLDWEKTNTIIVE